jgi:arabinose-5-phosphate isomerase
MSDQRRATMASITDVLRTESAAVGRLAELAEQQAEQLIAACELIRSACGGGQPGRLVVTGVGKAGLIGRKLAATFASTGTPSFFLHPAEARHGDLGMVQDRDVVLALSNSGSSDELVALLPSFKLIGVPLIAVVGVLESPLARHATVALSIGKVIEACPLGLAPSTSTTAMLALGDALALTVQRQRSFTPEQYARFHPGGALGRKLMTCREAMRSGERVPAVKRDATVLSCLRAITSARAGSVVLVDEAGLLVGIFTDGDLRRVLTRASDPATVLAAAVGSHATIPCRSVRADDLLQAALHVCAEKKINELPVVDATGRLVGLLDLQDLVERGFEV